MSQSSKVLTGRFYIPPHLRKQQVTVVTPPDALDQATSFGRFSKGSSYRKIVRNERINQLNAELTSTSDVLQRTTTVRFSDANLIFYVIRIPRHTVEYPPSVCDNDDFVL
jgi:hypothetical protein